MRYMGGRRILCEHSRLNEATIKGIIQEQENHDTMADKLSVKASVFARPVTELTASEQNYPFYG